MKRRVFFRLFPFNRLTFPLLLNVWETHGIDREFDVRIVETQNFASTQKKSESARTLEAGIGSFKPGDVFVYSFMTPHLPQIASEIRDLKSGCFSGWKGTRNRPLFVAGGPHVNGDADLPRAIGFDIVLPGPGEEAFLGLGEALLSNNLDIVETRHAASPHLNGHPPDAPKSANWDDYIPVSSYFPHIPPLELTRGCFHRCRYCQTGGQKPRNRDLASIARHLGAVRSRGFKRVNFIAPSSSEFAADRPRSLQIAAIAALFELCRDAGMTRIEYGIFPSELRPDSLNDQLLKLLQENVAHRKLTIGAQSGLDDRLRSIGRGHTVADIERAAAIANAHGFRANLDFIVAFPDETADEREHVFSFISQLNRRYRIQAHLHHFFPLAGSHFGDRFPAFLGESERRRLLDLRRHGVASDWWLAGEKNVRVFLDWLKKDFPANYARFW